MQQLWGPTREKARRNADRSSTADDITVVFPPVAVSDLETQIDVSPASESSRLPNLLYIAQFRPEKNHSLILDAFSKLLSSRQWSADKRPRLIFVGSVRDRDDATRVYKLRLHAHHIKEDVEFVCDASWPQVLDHLRMSSIGVNGMWNEHFGIGVVEYQASGLISVVNDSGGPKMDIVVDIDGGPTGKRRCLVVTVTFSTSANDMTGFHASTKTEYALAFARALDQSASDTLAMRMRARKSAARFSEEVFAGKWVQQMEKLVALQHCSKS
jgi:alpha-1,2-mannosyltransferase